MQIRNSFIVAMLICFLGISNFAWGKILILNGLTHEHQALQGEVRKGTIELKNISEKEQSVQIYQKDFWYSYTGESKHDAPGTMERSNANWLSINPQFVTLQPNETSLIEYQLTIPDNDSLIGTYWSVIMVEGITPPDTSTVKTGIKINTVVRYAVQIIANIGDTGKRNMQFINLNLSRQDSITTLQVAFKNTGERILRPEMGIEVFDSNGESQGVFKADRRKIYPGTSAIVELNLSSLPVGKYSGVLIADCSEDYAFGTNVNLEIKNE
ncbi:hypothetical protein MNBD_BACTEROID01-428 [hydrothermal vent metagenome]|uniref:DUF3324 domain-containing protein n=1 Tax=hydrothermal vent metagenome TaxID=652676 RepID=A0A3B0U997_9ZZZZ